MVNVASEQAPVPRSMSPSGHGDESVPDCGSGNVVIEPMTPHEEPAVVDLIRRNLEGYAEAGTVLAATFRRLEQIGRLAKAPGSRILVARDIQRGGLCIGGAGIGPLHGLSPDEGLGEVRDLVLDRDYRGHGLGARLLRRCIDEARSLGYKNLYLETTPQMEVAQKLFLRFGFRPVTQGPQKIVKGGPLPSYFILELSPDATSCAEE